MSVHNDWGPCFCPSCRKEDKVQKERSDRRNEKITKFLRELNVDHDTGTDIGLNNVWSLFGVTPILFYCGICDKNFILDDYNGTAKKTCPSCSNKNPSTVRSILKSEFSSMFD